MIALNTSKEALSEIKVKNDFLKAVPSEIILQSTIFI